MYLVLVVGACLVRIRAHAYDSTLVLYAGLTQALLTEANQIMQDEPALRNFDRLGGLPHMRVNVA